MGAVLSVAGRLRGFFEMSLYSVFAKVRLSVLLCLFFIYSFVWSPFFEVLKNQGTFAPRGLGYIYLKIES